MDEVAEALEAVGPRLKEIRARRKLKLSDVAERTGFSTSTLSRLESGNRKPSLDLLLPLAKIYQVPLDDLVGAPASGDPRIHPKPIRRHGSIFIPLTRHADGVQAFKMILPGAEKDVRIPQRTHEGYEWVYILAGALHLRLGQQITTLKVGEAAEFDTRTPHGFVSANDKPVELLGLFSPRGEQIHIRDA